MPVHSIVSRARPEREALELEVEVLSDRITVRSGDFRKDGADYVLAADEVWLFPDAVTGDTTFVAYLALNESDGSVVLVVDDFGSGEPPFQFEGTGYRRLHQVWMTVVADGETDLDNSTVHVYRVEQRGDRDAHQDQ